MHTRPSRHAFTLVEMLVVIAVVALLAAIAFPALNAARRSAARADGLSTLRNIGAAINAYSFDYNGNLPGPLKQGQSPTPAASGHLVNFVKPYLAPDEPPGYKSVQPSLVSNAWLGWFRRSGLPSAAAYYVNVVISDPANSGVFYFPFGNVGSKSQNNRPVTNPNLWKSNIKASATPAIWDWMGTSNNSVPFGELYDGINVLYYDWHIENVKDMEQAPGGPWKPKGW